MCSDPVITAGFIHAREKAHAHYCEPFEYGVLLLELTLRSAPDVLQPFINIVLSAFVHANKVLISLMTVKTPETQWSI